MTNLYGYVCEFNLVNRTMNTYKAIFRYRDTVFYVDRNDNSRVRELLYSGEFVQNCFLDVREYYKYRNKTRMLTYNKVWIVIPSKYKVPFRKLYHEFFDYLGLSTLSEEEKQHKVDQLKKSIECSVKGYNFHNKRLKEEEQRIKDLQIALTALENLK